MLPVTIIGGYLGAGKTTLVNHLLRHADGLRIAVLVNEFGALPIDEDLIEAQDDDIISIAGGCVCCSYGNDLVQAMLDLAKLDPRPDHVLLEASGVALPGAIAQSISLLTDFRLDGIVVVTDAETIRKQAADPYVGDTIERQLSDADLVFLNKCDLVSDDVVQDVGKWLRSKTGNAEIVSTAQCKVPREVALQAFPDGASLRQVHGDHRVGTFESQYLSSEDIVDAELVAGRLADASLALIRAKGFVRTQSGLRTIQVVGRRWSVSEAPPGAAPGLVVIANKGRLDLEGVAQALSGEKNAGRKERA